MRVDCGLCSSLLVLVEVCCLLCVVFVCCFDYW